MAEEARAIQTAVDAMYERAEKMLEEAQQAADEAKKEATRVPLVKSLEMKAREVQETVDKISFTVNDLFCAANLPSELFSQRLLRYARNKEDYVLHLTKEAKKAAANLKKDVDSITKETPAKKPKSYAASVKKFSRDDVLYKTIEERENAKKEWRKKVWGLLEVDKDRNYAQASPEEEQEMLEDMRTFANTQSQS